MEWKWDSTLSSRKLHAMVEEMAARFSCVQVWINYTNNSMEYMYQLNLEEDTLNAQVEAWMGHVRYKH